MRASVGLTFLVLGPVLGSVLALLLARSHLWQVVLSAILGETVGYLALKAWSSHATRQLMSGQGSGLIAMLPPRSLSERIVPLATLLAFGAVVGVLVALLYRVTIGVQR